uniref:Uncharacterized protein n=1 Tax=Sipha flava TaxID=143950 RepID=A0A2S2QEY2_9HEMI
MLAQKRRARARWQSTIHPLDKHALNSISNRLKKEFYKINLFVWGNNWLQSLTGGQLFGRREKVMWLDLFVLIFIFHSVNQFSSKLRWCWSLKLVIVGSESVARIQVSSAKILRMVQEVVGISAV